MIRFDEADDLIDICLDNVFKAVFARDTPESQGALSRLLSAVTGRELMVVGIITNEPPIDNIQDRQIRFDIHCQAVEGSLVNVEMSLNPDACEPVRLEFYAGKLFTGQDIHGVDKSYDDLREAYQIAILGKGMFFPDEEVLHQFEYYDPDRQVSLGGWSRIVTVELSKVDRVIEKPAGAMTALEHWAVFFRYLTDKSKRGKINEVLEYEEGIAMAGEVLLKISKNEAERARLMSEYKYVVDTQSKVVQAERKAREEMIRNLKALSVPVEKIAAAAGLSVEEIEKL
jgi:predicted transposase/invertase (TIGR01784 family)